LEKWVYDVSSTFPEITEPHIGVDSEDILWDYFKKERNNMEKLKGNSLEKFQINYDKHVRKSKTHAFSQRIERSMIKSPLI
jgi:hypothetical protein